jgi:hypothetical protein
MAAPGSGPLTGSKRRLLWAGSRHLRVRLHRPYAADYGRSGRRHRRFPDSASREDRFDRIARSEWHVGRASRARCGFAALHEESPAELGHHPRPGRCAPTRHSLIARDSPSASKKNPKPRKRFTYSRPQLSAVVGDPPADRVSGGVHCPRPSGRLRPLDIPHDRDGVRPLGSPSKERAGSRKRSPASTGLPPGPVKSPHVRTGSGPSENDDGLQAECRRCMRGHSGSSHGSSRALERCHSATARASIAPRVPVSATPIARVVSSVSSASSPGF